MCEVNEPSYAKEVVLLRPLEITEKVKKLSRYALYQTLNTKPFNDKEAIYLK